MSTPLLHKFATPAEVQRGCLASLNLKAGATDCAKSGITVTGAVPLVFNVGAIFPGTNGNYLSFGGYGTFKTVNSIKAEFNPNFAANDGVLHYLVDSTGGSFRVYKDAANNLVVVFGGTTILTIAYASYSAYWKTSERNVLVVTGITTANEAILNGTSIGTSATAWAVADPATIYIGADNAGQNTFSGQYHSLMVFVGTVTGDRLTVDEAKDFYTGQTYTYRNRAVLSLPMTSATFDPTNTRILDVSAGKIHASYAAGASAPSKVVGQKGFTFDGGDLFSGACNGRFNLSAISVAAQFAPTFAANDGAQHYLWDSTVASEYMVVKDAVNSLVFYSGNVVLTVLLAAYQNYWKVNQYNTLVFRSKSGDNEAILNGTTIGTSATAWAAVNPANYYIGCRYDSTLFFAGRYYQHEVFPIALTKIQAFDWQLNAEKMINAV